MARTITIALTEAEYRSLASAVALAEATFEDSEYGVSVKTLLRAWSEINRAWYG